MPALTPPPCLPPPPGSSLLTGPEGLTAKERDNLKRLKCLRRYRQRYGVEALLHRQLKERRVMATDGAAQQVCGAVPWGSQPVPTALHPPLPPVGLSQLFPVCPVQSKRLGAPPCRAGCTLRGAPPGRCWPSWPPGREDGLWPPIMAIGQPRHRWPSQPPGNTIGSWSPTYWSAIGQPLVSWDTIGLHGYQGTLLAHGHPLVTHWSPIGHPLVTHVLLCRAPFQQVSPISPPMHPPV